MNTKLIITLVTLAMAGAPAYAGNVADSNVQVGSTAGAYSGGNKVVSVSKPTLTSSLTSSPTLTSKLDLTSRPSLNNTTVIQAGKPTRIPVGVPGTVVAPVAVPQLFGVRGRPSVVRGVPLTLAYLNSCNPVATRRHLLMNVFATGASGRTQVVFSPNQAYAQKNGVVSGNSYGSSYNSNPYNNSSFNQSNTSHQQQVETARVGFSRTTGNYTCLGIMTVTAKKGEQIPLSTVLADSRDYALNHMEGFQNVYLVSVPEAIAAAGGVSTSGSGFSVSPGVVSAVTNMLTAGALSAGYSHSGGSTGTTARLGATFIVLSPVVAGKTGVVITQHNLRKYYQ